MPIALEDSSTAEAARRTQSDPIFSPRGPPNRVGTPYPKARPQLPPTKIPKLNLKIQTETLAETTQSGASVPRAYAPTTLKTKFYPSSVSAIGSSNLSPFIQPETSPVGPKYSKHIRPRKQLHPLGHSSGSRGRGDFFSGGSGRSRGHRLGSASSGQSEQSVKAQVFDSEGFLQGPHSTHNKRIQLYGKSRAGVSPSHNTNPLEAGDFCSNSTLRKPPLPPNIVRSGAAPPSKPTPRLATATISQSSQQQGNPSNTILEPLHFNPNKRSTSRESTGSGFSYSPRCFPSNNKQANLHSTTSLTLSRTAHEADSHINIHARKQKKQQQAQNYYSSPDTSIKCPLCTDQSQCHLHHRTMVSRYLTDLEWRIVNAVNIYAYKNGEEGQTPILIHIPPSKKRNMRSIMSVVQDRIRYPIGYAKYLYKMNGKKVTSPCELEMYNNYVVASNYDKCFKCVCYARRKSPLLVLGKESKHVRELRLKSYQYELYLAKKRCGEEKETMTTPSHCEGSYCPQDFHTSSSPALGIPSLGAGFRPQNSPLFKSCVKIKHPQEMSYQNPTSDFDYKGTISTAPLKDLGAMRKVPESANEILPSRYKGLVNDAESIFYAKKKPSKGVIDLSGDQTKIFYKDTAEDPRNIGEGDKCESLMRRKLYERPSYGCEEASENESLLKFNSIKTVRVEQAVPTHLSPRGSYNLMQSNNGSYSSLNPNDSINSMEQISSMVKLYEDGRRGKCESQTSAEGSWDTRRELLAGSVVDKQLNTGSGTGAQESQRMSNGECIGKEYDQQMNNEVSNAALTSVQSIIIDGNLESAPSRSYTIVANQSENVAGQGFSQNPPSDSTVPTEGQGSTPNPLIRFPFSDNNNNNNPVVNNRASPCGKLGSDISQYTPGVPLFAVRASPSIYLTPNQPYALPTNYFMPQPSSPKYPQAQIQQIYPVEVLNQRPAPFGSILLNSSTGYRSQDSSNAYENSSSYTDEIDIPFSPMYQRFQQLTPFVQVQPTQFLAAPPAGSPKGMSPSQQNYLGPAQARQTINRSMGLVAIQQPSRRNVAIQMGVPSAHESSNNSKSSSTIMPSPRPSQPIYPSSQYNHYNNSPPSFKELLPRFPSPNFNPKYVQPGRLQQRPVVVERSSGESTAAGNFGNQEQPPQQHFNFQKQSQQQQFSLQKQQQQHMNQHQQQQQPQQQEFAQNRPPLPPTPLPQMNHQLPPHPQSQRTVQAPFHQQQCSQQQPTHMSPQHPNEQQTINSLHRQNLHQQQTSSSAHNPSPPQQHINYYQPPPQQQLPIDPRYQQRPQLPQQQENPVYYPTTTTTAQQQPHRQYHHIKYPPQTRAPLQQQQHNNNAQDSSEQPTGVLPPPTRYRDALYEANSGRKKNNYNTVKYDEGLNNNKENNNNTNDEYYQIHDTRQSENWRNN